MLLLPPLDSLRFFEAAARHQNFSRGAAELGVTSAAVGYRVRLLESISTRRCSPAASAACASTAAAGPT